MNKTWFILILCLAAFLPVRAQEGMWMLTQIGQLDLQKKGLMIPVEEIYSPGKPCLANAILELGGGTASFWCPPKDLLSPTIMLLILLFSVLPV